MEPADCSQQEKYPDGRYGSRIAVRWDLNVGPLDPGTVVLLPEAKRLPSNVALPTVCPLKQELYESVVDAMNVRNQTPVRVPQVFFFRATRSAISSTKTSSFGASGTAR